MEETTLIPVQKLDVAVVFSEKGLDEILTEIERLAMAHVPDVSTDQGRKDIASMAYKVARSKTTIDNFGKDVIADWKKKTDNINQYRKKARDFLDPLRDRVRQPLTDWEAEEERKKKEHEERERLVIQGRIAELQQYGCVISFFDVASMDVPAFEKKLSEVKDAFETEQKRAEAERQERIRLDAEAAKERERLAAERAELEKLRAEQSEREAKIRAEQEAKEAAIREAQEKIETEKRAIEYANRKAQERVEREAFEKKAREEAQIAAEKAAKEKAERDAKEKAETEARAKAEAERQAALLPDKEKLIAWVGRFREIPDPALSSKDAKEVWRIGSEYIELTLKGIEAETEKL